MISKNTEEWYTEEETGTHVVDIETHTPEYTIISLSLKKDGSVGYAIFKPSSSGHRKHGKSIESKEFKEAFSAILKSPPLTHRLKNRAVVVYEIFRALVIQTLKMCRNPHLAVQRQKMDEIFEQKND